VAIYRHRLDCFTPFAKTGKGGQRRDNPPSNRLCEERSDVAIYRHRLDCFTPFAKTGKGAQRRGNLSASLAEMVSMWQCGFFTKEPQRNEATLCLYII
jgi:hypothetical protein